MNWSTMITEKLSSVSASPPTWMRFEKTSESRAFSVARYLDVTPEMVGIVVAHPPTGGQYGHAVVTVTAGGMCISIYGGPELAPDDAEVVP